MAQGKDCKWFYGENCMTMKKMERGAAREGAPVYGDTVEVTYGNLKGRKGVIVGSFTHVFSVSLDDGKKVQVRRDGVKRIKI